MRPVLLAGLRSNIRRWGALGLVIALAVSFLTASLGVGDLMVNYGVKQTEDRTRGASVVISEFKGPEALAAAKDRARREGLLAYAPTDGFATFNSNGQSYFIQATDVRPAAFAPQSVASGRLPSNAHEFVLDSDTAEKAKLSLGTSVVLRLPAQSGETSTTVTLVGLIPAGQTPTGLAILAPELLQDGAVTFSSETHLLVAKAEPAQFAGLKDATVSTRDALIAEARENQEGRAAVLPFLLFSVIALIVAVVVISTTMSVLAARRARELALLRLLGASRSTVTGAMLLEALILGGASSFIGLALGLGLLAAAVRLLPILHGVDFLPSLPTLAGSWILGVLSTLAGTYPALRLAGGIRPLQAVTQDLSRGKATRSRTVLRIIALAVFAVSTAGVVFFGQGSALGPAVLCGAVSALALLPLFTWFAPVLGAMLTRLLSRSTAARLGAANIESAPARSGSTAAALLIGLTLVTMLMTAVSTSKSMAISSIEHDSPFDLDLALMDNDAMSRQKPPKGDNGSWQPKLVPVRVTENQLARIRAIKGVEGAALLTPVWKGADVKNEQGEFPGPVLYALPESVEDVARGDLRLLKDRQVFGESSMGGNPELPREIRGSRGSVALDPGIQTRGGTPHLVVTAATARQIGPVAVKDAPEYLVIKVSDGVTMDEVRSVQQQIGAVTGLDPAFMYGGVQERLGMLKALDLLLMIALGLLGLSVVIAIIGVGDSLALSQLERTRDISLLRALGMSRAGVGAILTWESIGLTLSALAVALPVGILYGWMGAAAAVPGETLSAKGPDLEPLWLAVTILAGLLLAVGASVIPSRRAQKIAPAAGLVAE